MLPPPSASRPLFHLSLRPRLQLRPSRPCWGPVNKPCPSACLQTLSLSYLRGAPLGLPLDQFGACFLLGETLCRLRSADGSVDVQGKVKRVAPEEQGKGEAPPPACQLPERCGQLPNPRATLLAQRCAG